MFCNYVVKSWEAACVKKNFRKIIKKCGISNAMVGEEDDLLWQESDKEKENSKDSKDDGISESDTMHMQTS